MMTRHTTAAYRLDEFQNAFAFELVRLRDKASALFQGDDATLWEENMKAIEKVPLSHWGSVYPRGLDDAFDQLCSGYDDVLTAAVVLPLTHAAMAEADRAFGQPHRGHGRERATVHTTVQHQGQRMNGTATIQQMLKDPAISDWLKNALRSALVRDCVDAARDAELLASLLRLWAEQEIRVSK